MQAMQNVLMASVCVKALTSVQQDLTQTAEAYLVGF